MALSYLLALLPLAHLSIASPLEPRQFNVLNPCASCFRSSWTQGQECKTQEQILSTMSRILNPPAEATSTYTPSQWCTDWLRQTDLKTFSETLSTATTYTSRVFTQPIVTKTDLDHPTATAFCPIPSSGMECGWDSNTISPIDQGQDWSVADEGITSAEECHQACLRRNACKAYRWDAKQGSPCEVFNVGIGPGGTNLIDATPSGTQWFDRECQVHLPTGCAQATTTAPPSRRVVRAAKPAPVDPLITAAPVAAPEISARNAALAKRSAPLPEYMADLAYFWSSIYITPACSCIITSAKPPVADSTTSTFTRYTETFSITTTIVDEFTVTVTPRETTTYVSVN